MEVKFVRNIEKEMLKKEKGDMRKKTLLCLGIVCMIGMTGCNYQMVDTNFSYDKAIIKLANDEVIEVEVKTWCDYDGEQLQITAKDGTVYLTNSYRCDLIKNAE